MVSRRARGPSRGLREPGGSFAAPVTLSGLELPIALELGDLVGSSLPDIAVLSLNQASVRVYRNRSGLAFAAQQSASALIDDPADLALADVDLDGDLDLVWITRSSNTLAWSENHGNSTFVSGGVIDTLPADGKRVQSVDLDTDGDEDLLICLSSPSNFSNSIAVGFL